MTIRRLISTYTNIATAILITSVTGCSNMKVEDPWLAEQANTHATAATAAQKDGAFEAARVHQKKSDQYKSESKKSNYGIMDFVLDSVLGIWIDNKIDRRQK